MSYIHEALKKAQKERNGRRAPYRPMASSRRIADVFSKRWVSWGLGSGIIVLLAFAAYSWLDSPRNSKHSQESIPVNTPVAPPRVRESSTHAKDFFERGRAHQRDGRLRQARQWYEKALKADPGLVVALNNLGVIHMQDGRYHAAKKHFEKAIRLKPGYVDPYYNLACLGALRNRTAESLRYLQKAVSLNPDVKGWAAQDADFKGLQHLREFHAIITPKP